MRSSSCVAWLNVGVRELGAGELLGSTSAGIGDGGGCCCCWFAVMVAVSAVATSSSTSPAGTISMSPASGIPSGRLVCATSLVTAQMSEVQQMPFTTVG